MPPVLYSQALSDIRKWKFGDKTKGKSATFVPITSPSSERLKIQLNTVKDPLLTTPFGINLYDDDGTKTRKNLDFNVTHEPLQRFLHAVDKLIVDVAVERSASWFKKKLSRAEVLARYIPLLRASVDPQYPPRLRTKVNTGGKAGSMKVLRPVDMESKFEQYVAGTDADVTKGSHGMVIVEISAVWLSSTQFGVSVVTTDFHVFNAAVEETYDFIWPDTTVPKEYVGEKRRREEETDEEQPHKIACTLTD